MPLPAMMPSDERTSMVKFELEWVSRQLFATSVSRFSSLVSRFSFLGSRFSFLADAKPKLRSSGGCRCCSANPELWRPLEPDLVRGPETKSGPSLQQSGFGISVNVAPIGFVGCRQQSGRPPVRRYQKQQIEERETRHGRSMLFGARI
jgi:hypothetical protein